jgi:hypothetical protein
MKQMIWGILGLLCASGCSTLSSEKQAAGVYQDAVDAYIYGYPLVLMQTTKDVMTATPTLTLTKAPINQFLHIREFPTPRFTDVVSPNADTLYSTAWLDLSKEPIILTVPDVGERYYLMPLLSEWTNVFASLGTRTTGNKAASFAIIGPDWKGSLPEGVAEILSPTSIVWIIGRTETKGPHDYEAVNQIQDQYRLIPLSGWGKGYTPPKYVPLNKNVDVKIPPVEQVSRLDALAFFSKLSELLKTTPPTLADHPILAKLARIGIVPGQDFDASKLTPEDKSEIERAVADAREKIQNEWKEKPFARKVNNWSILEKPVGNYGTDYVIRAVVAYGGLGANLPQDAIYPATNVDADGNPLTGKNKYVIHFDKDELPYVQGFWSVTMYNDRQFFVENPINRYAIGDRDALKYNSDGSLDIFIQNEPPSKEEQANWLPAPKGPFNLIMRLYWPDQEILDGAWAPPPVEER